MSDRAIVEKALTPAMSAAIYELGYERVAGYVVPVDALPAAPSLVDLIESHSLRFPGSPFGEPVEVLDVLRFPANSNLSIERAIGGDDAESAQRNGGTFIEHPPFTGTGFVNTSFGSVPLYWVPTHRPPVGTELARHRDGRPVEVLARYGGAAVGWVFRDDLEAARPPHRRDLSRFTGGLARAWGSVYLADLADDGYVDVVTRDQDAPASFVPGVDGWRSARLDPDAIDEYFELDVRVPFDGLEFRVTGRRAAASGRETLEAVSLSHDVRILEGLGLTKVDRGVYEADLPGELLDIGRTEQVQLPGWPGAPVHV